MGKLKALKLGIIKGVAHTAGALADHVPAKCPFCGYRWNVRDLILQESSTGEPAQKVITEHIKACMAIRAPNQKIKHSCGQEISITELDDHLRAVHGWNDVDFEYRKVEKNE